MQYHVRVSGWAMANVQANSPQEAMKKVERFLERCETDQDRNDIESHGIDELSNWFVEDAVAIG